MKKRGTGELFGKNLVTYFTVGIQPVYRVQLEDFFFCEEMKREIQVGVCLDNFVNAETKCGDKKNPPPACCLNCAQGKKVRDDFSSSC